MKQGRVYFHDQPVGIISNRNGSYEFRYDPGYCALQGAKPISLTLPLTEKPYVSRTLHPFFDGLIPEGWLLDMAAHNWKIDPRDRLQLLLTLCSNCIGAASVRAIEEVEE